MQFNASVGTTTGKFECANVFHDFKFIMHITAIFSFVLLLLICIICFRIMHDNSKAIIFTVLKSYRIKIILQSNWTINLKS